MASKADSNGFDGQPEKPPLCTSVTQTDSVLNKPKDAICIRTRSTTPQVKAMLPAGKVENTTLDKSHTCKSQLVEQPKAKPPQRSISKEQSLPAQCKFEATQAKPGRVRITFARKKEKNDVQEFLRHHLITMVGDIEQIIYEDSGNKTSVVVCFPNQKGATRALQALNTSKDEYTVTKPIDHVIQRKIQSEIKSFEKKEDLKQKSYLEHHNKKTKDLEARLGELVGSKKRFRPLEEHERICKEREVLHLKIEELEQQRKEFEKYVCDRMSVLTSPAITDEESLQTELKVVERDLFREYYRFLAALPIYGRRSEIVQTILNNHVTVLVGETGSGKSTQVVQYLYEAGVAEHGLIVCTQPRKVAAITLAKHVSREMKINLGDELGYRVGMSVKCSKLTKIVYMTDHALLNECITDHMLSKYSCVLVDEAHERSINTDMLLAFIKQCLPSRRDLKVVIMSATIEPELFVKYFEVATEHDMIGTKVSTIKVSGRTFPVEVEYHPPQCGMPLSPDSNYVMYAVDIAKRIHSNEPPERIHSNEPPGGILVFLTCAPEIERACRALEHLNDKVVILPLHGKLPPDEQQKVFEEYSRKRKIIFATNVAETSVTIPGVKYVVDTGLAKEMQFDPRKNMDSLEVRLISKSSAEQRKGRAGRVSAGKCYRLYSSEDYTSKMPERTKPEILRIQLSQVVLKMLEFGVPNVLTFNFVEHPDRTSLEVAVETLRFVGAIQGDTLTDVGKKMAVLPLIPQLAKILLDGISQGLGTEALFSVAISSLAGQVFFRGGTDKMKQESDKMKLAFCHPIGDQMTNLSVHQCWQEQERSNRTQWCLEKSVNAKSMRIIEETAKELQHLLKQHLRKDLSLKLKSLEAADCYLGKLYFDAFLTNLAVYLGHEQAGYMTTTNNSGSFVIFPGSSLKHMSSTPKYVIYEKTLKTSRHFLTQVMCVRQEWIDEAVQSGRLSEDPAEKFKDLMFKPLHAIAIGPQTYREIIRKRDEVLKVVQVNAPQCAATPVIDFSTTPKQWGIVRAFAQYHCHTAVELALVQSVREVQAQFKKETKEFGVTKEQDSTRLVIGAGGTVQRVIMPFQFRTVVAVCSNEGEWIDKLKRQMTKYGEVKKTQVKQTRNDFRLLVTYSTPTAAQRALTECKYPKVTLRPWHGQQFTLSIQWERRERGPFAHLSFDSPMHCIDAYTRLRCFLGIKIRPDRDSQSKLFLSGRELCSIDRDNLRDRIGCCIRGDFHFNLKMGYKRYSEQNQIENALDYSCDSSEDELDHDNDREESNIHQIRPQTLHECLRRELEDVVAQYAQHGTYSLTFDIPNQQAIFYRAFVTFDDPDEGYRVLYSDLKHEFIGGKLLALCPNLKCMVSLRKEIFVLMKESLEQTRKDLIGHYSNILRIKIIPPNDECKEIARISIQADDVKAFAVAQNRLHTAAQPVVIDCKTTELHEYILSRTCCKELDDIQANTSTYMCRDLNAMCIKVYGAKPNQKTATARVEEKAHELFSDGATVTELSLGECGKPPGLMKCLVTRYGCDLEHMLAIDGVRRVGLNPHRQIITLLATTSGQDAVKTCIEELSKPHVRKLEGEYEVDCSACFTPVEDPKDLIRLECCGHAFHTDCIAVQVKSDTLTLPVCCAKEECSQEFLLKDFENLQKRLKFRTADLVSAALRNYMEKNGDTYKNCPTPDCKMIYIKTDDSKPFICGNCTVSTCRKCHEQYHAGMSCEVYKRSMPSDDELLEWMNEDPDNRKKCPQCSCYIEKNEGCMHVTCVLCRAHICWQCMEYFKTATACYDHQPYCPAQYRLPPRPAPPINNPAPIHPLNVPVIVHPMNNPAPIHPVNNPAPLPPIVNPAGPPRAGRHVNVARPNPPANRENNERSCIIL